MFDLGEKMATGRFFYVALLVGTTICCFILTTSQCKERRLTEDFNGLFVQKKSTRNGIIEIYNHFNVLLSNVKQYGINQHLINTADLGIYSLKVENKVQIKYGVNVHEAINHASSRSSAIYESLAELAALGPKERRRYSSNRLVGSMFHLMWLITFHLMWLITSAVFPLILMYECYFPDYILIKGIMPVPHFVYLYDCVLHKNSLCSAKRIFCVRSKNQRLHFVAMLLSWFICTWTSISTTSNSIFTDKISLVPFVVSFNILLVYATLWMLHYFEGGNFITYIKQEFFNTNMISEQVHNHQNRLLKSRNDRRKVRQNRAPISREHKSSTVQNLRRQTFVNAGFHSKFQSDKIQLNVSESRSVSDNCGRQKIGFENNSQIDQELQNESFQTRILNECKSIHQNEAKEHATLAKATTYSSDMSDDQINSNKVGTTYRQDESVKFQDRVSSVSNSSSPSQLDNFELKTHIRPTIRRDRSVSEDDDSGQVTVTIPSYAGTGNFSTCMQSCSSGFSCQCNLSNTSTYITGNNNVFMNTSNAINQPSSINTQSSAAFGSFLDEKSRGTAYEFSKEMEYEWMRLLTFKPDNPISCSLLRLAESGFYSTDNGDEVKCFSCGECYDKWRIFDKPHIIHEAISPCCSMVLGNETRNKPVLSKTWLRLREIISDSIGNCAGQADSRYVMSSTPKGIAVIINNEIFWDENHGHENYSLEDRNGTHIDSARMRRLWGHLGFEVKYFENTSAREMFHIIKDIALIDHSKYDCLVICILTHGDCGILFGSDGSFLTIDQITAHFQSGLCQSLAGKPKLFFIQACQGSSDQTGYAIPVDADTLCNGVIENHPVRQRIIESLPQEADFLLSLSTVPGYVSYRCSENGSWYIRSLKKNLLNHFSQFDLASILALVNLDVGKNEYRGYKQMSMHMSTLRKRVYFS